jgi:hypothetical protein
MHTKGANSWTKTKTCKILSSLFWVTRLISTSNLKILFEHGYIHKTFEIELACCMKKLKYHFKHRQKHMSMVLKLSTDSGKKLH